MYPAARIYCFNWPSHVSGTDTKFVHLLRLLHRDYDITVVPNTREQFEQKKWRRWLAGLGVKRCWRICRRNSPAVA